MTLFWLFAALLAAAALLFVVLPLLARRAGGRISRRAANLAVHRDQLRELGADLRAGTLGAADYDKARRELEARLLQDVEGAEAAAPGRSGPGIAAALGAAIPVCAVALYLVVGNPDALSPPPAAQGRDGGHGVDAQQVEAMVERLAERMRSDPENAEGWSLLGRSYGALGRFAQAADAYANAVQRAPRDAQLLADYADALAMARDRRLQGEPEKLVARALEIDPRNLKALALAGTAAFERNDYTAAAGYWERMLPLVPRDSEDARSIRANVEEARALARQRVAD